MIIRSFLVVTLLISLSSCNKAPIRAEGVSYAKTERSDIAQILLDPTDIDSPQINIPIIPNWVSKQRTETSSHYAIILQDDKYPAKRASSFISIIVPKGKFTNTNENLLSTAKSTYDSYASAYKILDGSSTFAENDINFNHSVEFWYVNEDPTSPKLKDFNFTMVFSPVENSSDKCGPVIISYVTTGIEDMKLIKQVFEANTPLFRETFSYTEFKNF
ncbi:MAG: hypothetical protein HOA17_10010 [Candidatus Melainabacteria bacterium]|nr:hypothetical protein [Candidatus Melainabacteria bacterium]